MTKKTLMLLMAIFLMVVGCGGTETKTTNEERAEKLISALASSSSVKLEDTEIYVESDLTIGAGKKLIIGKDAKLFLSEGSNLTVNGGAALVVEEGGHLEVGSSVVTLEGSLIEVKKGGFLGMEETLESNGGRVVNEGKINTSNNLNLNEGAVIENIGEVVVTVEMVVNDMNSTFINIGNLQVLNKLIINGGLLKNGVDDGSHQNLYDGDNRNMVLEEVQLNGRGAQLVNLPGWYGRMASLVLGPETGVTNLNEEPGSLSADTCEVGSGTIQGQVYWCEGFYPPTEQDEE